GSITEHTQLWWSVRPHLAYPTVELRIMDGQPDLGEAQSLAALSYALAARCARAVDEGERLPDVPRRLLEENLWRAIRYGISGELSQAKAAIDAIGALLPVLEAEVEGGLVRDFERALANLRVTYADAAAKPPPD